MVRLLFHHLRGARATEVDVILLGAHRELILGRAPSAAIRFDAQRDHTVGRQHARIVPVDASASQFLVDDLQSRNGTYVNGERIGAQTMIHTGDIIRLGAEGPEMRFAIETELP